MMPPHIAPSRRCLNWLLVLLLAGLDQARSADFGVSSSGHQLTLAGKPFFWLGDTVWLLTQLPSHEELELYLRTRAEQGFTVIQLTAVMGEERVWGTLRQTSRGDTPFIEGNVLKPAVTPGKNPADSSQYDYWDHLDYTLERIHAHGFRAALVTYFVGWQGDGYKFLKPDNAFQYGRFLGERYRGKPEIIWVLGGDNTPKNEDQRSVWRLVAKGLAEGLTGAEDYSKVLMTYHINGNNSSSQHWHESPWLDFNMAQTWSAYQEIYPLILRDYQKNPPKPCGLGEGAYEDGPQYPTKPINARVIRQQACWSYFAGGYHTSGNGNVWHFDSLKPELTQTWKEALHSRGAETLRHVKQFLTTLPWWQFVPDPSLLAEGQGGAAKLNVALRGARNDAVAVYLAHPIPIRLHLEKLPAAAPLSARWINPATGQEQDLGLVDAPTRLFTPPAGWEDAFLLVKRQSPSGG